MESRCAARPEWLARLCPSRLELLKERLIIGKYL
jgi:hypothetical protein